MCSSGQLCSGSGRPTPSSASDNSSNSGSQYALCALGVGLVALGIVMIVWSVVPANVPGNSSSSKPTSKGNTASVAFVLAGVGVAMLLLSICLGVRSKHRQQRQAAETATRISRHAAEVLERETEEASAQYDVPTYEEAVGSGQYPAQPSHLRSSSSASQLPAYEDLVDAVQHEDEGPASSVVPSGAALTPPELQPAPSNRQNGLGRKLRPLKVRRIKSEKLRLKNVSNQPQAHPPSIEPLTPPPQYDDQMPRL